MTCYRYIFLYYTCILPEEVIWVFKPHITSSVNIHIHINSYFYNICLFIRIYINIDIIHVSTRYNIRILASTYINLVDTCLCPFLFIIYTYCVTCTTRRNGSWHTFSTPRDIAACDSVSSNSNTIWGSAKVMILWQAASQIRWYLFSKLYRLQ